MIAMQLSTRKTNFDACVVELLQPLDELRTKLTQNVDFVRKFKNGAKKIEQVFGFMSHGQLLTTKKISIFRKRRFSSES